MPGANVITAEVLAHIKEQETFAAEPYRDLGGKLAIGYGHSVIQPPIVVLGMKWTEEEAAEVLRADLEYVGRYVKRKVTQPMNDFEYGSLCSLGLNIGEGNFARSNVLKFLNSPDITHHRKKAAAAFLEHNRAEDPLTKEVRPYLGLTVRRIIEAALFLRKS